MFGARTFTRILSLLLLITLSACSAPGLEHYSDRQPQFVPERFFLGPMQAHGVVKNRSGEVIRTFTADLHGSWQDGRGLLKEKFTFNDGEIQYRNWKLTPQTGDSGVRSYTATAEDAVGPAQLSVAGNAGFMEYVLEVPYGDSTIEVAVDDRMYLTADNVMIAESELTKWGFRVGEIVLTIFKLPAAPK